MAKQKFEPIHDEASCKSQLGAIGDALYAIGGKWKLRIIIALMHGKSRFNELQRTIEGISAKVLAAELKELELNGFVKRNVYAETPIVIEYELTDYAVTLQPVLGSLSEWGSLHRKKIRQSMKQEFEEKKGMAK
ncbi:MAG TPA: helix-turn-helix domain-containing protein [Chryseosolibacter sp.]